LEHHLSSGKEHVEIPRKVDKSGLMRIHVYLFQTWLVKHQRLILTLLLDPLTFKKWPLISRINTNFLG
jgi:hypothetical protein